jgi:ATP-dependent 26S proteasome regulatory subunit
MLELLNQLDGFDTRGDVKVSIRCVSGPVALHR